MEQLEIPNNMITTEYFIVLKGTYIFPTHCGTLKQMKEWQLHYNSTGNKSAIYRNTQSNIRKAMDWQRGGE